MNLPLLRKAVLPLAIAWLGMRAAAEDDPARAGQDFFENKIRPVLVKHCFKCHGAEKQKGGLRLDQRDFVLEGGKSGRVVLPGDPGGSLLIRAIRRIDPDVQMPPEDEDRLSGEEVESLVAWVKMGVPFPGAGGGVVAKPAADIAKARQFWSLQPLGKPVPPQAEPKGWARNPIDQFVLAGLEAARVTPSQPADKLTLLRRATYDLTGLPPTCGEIDAFVADASPDAFAKVVDRLLASPQYGVHWARHWFDVARYGDTRWVGAAEDRRWPFAYTYRDWVIQALNDDVPYDRFVSLQLAADQIADARPADQAALGFLTLGRWFTGTLPDVIDDQIDVVTRGLLGVSVQCARCHDHKFDPISTQDYYSLYGLFGAARMPVDGSGILADLPEVAPHPVDAATEQNIAAMRGELDEFLRARAAGLRDEFRAPDKMRQYLLAVEGVLKKTDNEVRAFAKAEGFDERILQRWVRCLKNTVRNPHPIFAPWHALAAIPEADFAAQSKAAIEKEKTGKLNRLVLPLLEPVPESLAELARRYVDLLIKFDAAEMSGDFEQEALRQVLRNNDSPVQVSLGELGQFLSADEMKRLVEMRRKFLAKMAALPERADHFLNYQHEAAPVVAEIHDFLQQRRKAVADDLRSPEKIASYLLTAREAGMTPDGKFKSLAKSRQLSERLLRRWMDYLQQLSQQDDRVFATWRVFAAVDEKDFAGKAAQITEQARKAAGNQAVAKAFATPPASLAEVAKRYGELIVLCNRAEPFPDADQEAIRKVAVAAESPLRLAPEDAVDSFTQKDLDELKNKERKLLRIYLETPGAPPRGMVLRESARGYAQRVFVRGNPNIPGEPAHGGFLKVLSTEPSRAFTPGRGRLELAQAIGDVKNPLTARVMVNRVWQWHFGAGLVRTPSDFGTRGTAPTHPELLDWLAGQFIMDGWSLKKLHRQVLLSATWQQSSKDNPAYRATDPENRLLWRMSRRRLGFEELRDSLLAAGGRMDSSIGGEPRDLTRNMIRRRTVFGTVDRVTLPGFYRYFDFPGADAHVPERHETIVAQQALYLMNNGFVMEQATHVARRGADVASSDPGARLDMLYRLVLGRNPVPQERALGLEFIKSQTSASPDSDTPSPADPWQYGWGSYNETRQRVTEFQPLPATSGNQPKGGSPDIDPVLSRISLNARGGVAGPSSEVAAIRRWIAPRSGKVSITGSVAHQLNSSQPMGDGVRARIVSNRLGKLGDWIVHGTEEATEFQGVAVEPGDTIDFVTDARGRDMQGGFTWAPMLRMETPEPAKGEKALWDAAKDFKMPAATPRTFDAWERLAQVLLEANEFTFLD